MGRRGGQTAILLPEELRVCRNEEELEAAMRSKRGAPPPSDRVVNHTWGRNGRLKRGEGWSGTQPSLSSAQSSISLKLFSKQCFDLLVLTKT